MGYFAMSKAGGNTTTMHLLAKDVGSLGVISSISLLVHPILKEFYN
jgi:hypothetical protein